MPSANLNQQGREIRLEELLGRPQAQLDAAAIREKIAGQVILVTGAAGSIGSELCRQLANLDAGALVGLDQAETPLFLCERELNRQFPQLPFHAELGDVTRSEEMYRVMAYYDPSIVFHAAGYKHVSMMEKNPFAAVENNIFGTWNVARAAASQGVKHFVLISTDKAVRPEGMMGASKRVAELAVRALQRDDGTKFVVVRFGNVLGSGGSVVPIFMDQIARGGPVTITHPEVARYFMTSSEAAQLVLQAFALGDGGETLVLDMGRPVKILDLAKKLIRLHGLEPDRDIQIEFTGLGPGEKLLEEMSFPDDAVVGTSHPLIKSLVSPRGLTETQVDECLSELREAVDTRSAQGVTALLKAMVPTYGGT